MAYLKNLRLELRAVECLQFVAVVFHRVGQLRLGVQGGGVRGSSVSSVSSVHNVDSVSSMVHSSIDSASGVVVAGGGLIQQLGVVLFR